MKIQIVIDDQTAKRALIRLGSKRGVGVLLALAILVAGSVALALEKTPTHTFAGGTLISSAEMNANFDALFTEISQLRADLDSGARKGEKGDQGPTGPQGPPGDQGTTGLPGERGKTGPKGPDSTIAGAQGKQGAPGPQGVATLIKTVRVSSLAECGNRGGVRIEVGIDGANGKPVDGTLEDGENDPSLTRTICDGKDGNDGIKGDLGDPGFTLASYDINASPSQWTMCAAWKHQGSTSGDQPTCSGAGYDVCVLTTFEFVGGGACAVTGDQRGYTLTAYLGTGIGPKHKIICAMHCYKFNLP